MNQIDMEKIITDADLIMNKTFKNFPDLCRSLKIDVIKSGGAKVKFLEMLEEYFEIEKNGHKIIIGKRKMINKKPFGFDKDAEPYKAMGRLFYSFLDSKGFNKVHYITNGEFALYFNLINESHKSLASGMPWECKEFKTIFNVLIDTDYCVLVNELIRDKIRSFAKRDIYNTFEEVWMADGKELTNTELIQMLNEKKNWITNKYGVLVNDETRETFKESEPVAWGTASMAGKVGYQPKDAQKKALIAINEERKNKRLPRYYKSWKIAYVMNPYEIQLRNEWQVITDKRIELVDNRMKWNNYSGIWREVAQFARDIWIDWINNKITVQPNSSNVLRVKGIDEIKWRELMDKIEVDKNRPPF